MPDPSLLHRPWRVGRKVPRHIYAMVGAEPSNSDEEVAVSIGSATIAEIIAHAIVHDHNSTLKRLEQEGPQE